MRFRSQLHHNHLHTIIYLTRLSAYFSRISFALHRVPFESGVSFERSSEPQPKAARQRPLESNRIPSLTGVQPSPSTRSVPSPSSSAQRCACCVRALFACLARDPSDREQPRDGGWTSDERPATASSDGAQRRTANSVDLPCSHTAQRGARDEQSGRALDPIHNSTNQTTSLPTDFRPAAAAAAQQPFRRITTSTRVHTDRGAGSRVKVCTLDVAQPSPT